MSDDELPIALELVKTWRQQAERLERELAEAQRVVTAAARVRQFISVAGDGRCEPGWIGAICDLYSAEFIYRTEYQQAAADQPGDVVCKCDDHDARYCVNRANRGSPCVCRCHGASDTAAHSGAATTTGTPPTSLTNTDKSSAY